MKVIFLDKIPLNSDYEYTINTGKWDNIIAKLAIPKSTTEQVIDFDEFLKLYPYNNWIECNLENIDNVNYFVSVDLHKNPYHNTVTSYNYMLAYDGTKVHHFFVENVKHISSKRYSETNITSRYDISLKKNLFAEYNINENFNGNSHIHTKRKHCKVDDVHNRNVEDNYEPTYCKERYDLTITSFHYYDNGWKIYNLQPLNTDLYAYIFATEKIGLTLVDFQTNKQYRYKGYGCDLPMLVYCIPFTQAKMYTVYNNEIYEISSTFDDVDQLLLSPEIYKVVISDMPPINIDSGIRVDNDTYKFYVDNTRVVRFLDGTNNTYMINCRGRNDDYEPYFTGKFNISTSYYNEDKLNYYPYNCYCVVNGNNKSYYNYKINDNFIITYDFSVENIIRSIGYYNAILYSINGDETKSLLCEYVQDNTLLMATDYWLDYIAQNKNYYYQGVTVPIVKGISNTMVGGATAVGYAVSGSPQATIGASGNSLLSAINASINVANTMMNWDNIKNTPNSVKTLGINIQKSIRVGRIKPYCLRYSVVPSLLPIIENKFKHYGYQYDDECDYKDFFAKENYNYILTIEDVIDKKAISMTNYERKVINDIFKRGITMFGENCIMYDEQSNSYIDYTQDNDDRS